MIDNLMELNIQSQTDYLQRINQNNKTCLYLPLMASYSECQLGALNAKKFSERLNLAENLSMTEDRFKIISKPVDMLGTLTMS